MATSTREIAEESALARARVRRCICPVETLLFHAILPRQVPEAKLTRMKVLMIPDFSAGNPYQVLLKRALEQHGSEVAFGQFDRFAGAVLRPALRHGWPKVLHLHWIHTLIMGRRPWIRRVKAIETIAELLLARLLGRKVVWTVHNVTGHETDHADELELTFYRWVVRVASGVIVHTQHAKAAVSTAYGLSRRCTDKIQVVPHGHYADWYSKTVSRADARAQLGLAEDERVVLIFGAVRRYKGIARFIERLGPNRKTQIRIVLAGNPGDEEIAKQMHQLAASEERVVLRLGFIPDDEVQVLFRAADIVTLPQSRYLTSGSLLLAMSFGCPLLLYDHAFAREVVGDYGAIYLDEDSQSTICEELDKVSAAELARMGEANLAAIDSFGWDAIGAKTLAVYGKSVPAAVKPKRSPQESSSPT